MPIRMILRSMKPVDEIERVGFEQIAVHRGEQDAPDERGHRAPAEPEQRRRRDEARHAAFQLVRNSRHGRGLDEIEVPEQPDPHHAGPDMQPAQQERPEDETVELGLGEINQENHEREREIRRSRYCGDWKRRRPCSVPPDNPKDESETYTIRSNGSATSADLESQSLRTSAMDPRRNHETRDHDGREVRRDNAKTQRDRETADRPCADGV